LTKDKGFTLVEILVVVVIMAIVISLAILSIGVAGHDSQLDDESRRIEGLMGLLHERAILEGRDFGVRLDPTSYEFLVYNSFRDRWERITQEQEYRHRDLPKGLVFQLELDSQVVVLKAVDKNLSTDALPNPQLAIAASGEGTPFRLTLVREQTNAQASVDGDAMGKLSHETSDQRKQQNKRS
jgi:general secretion pathway protein H